MAAMTKTQRTHLLVLLQKKIDKALDKIAPKSSYRYRKNGGKDVTDLSAAALVEAIKAGEVVARPLTTEEEEDQYCDILDHLIWAKDLKTMLLERQAQEKYDTIRDTLRRELEEVESRLIFQDVAGVEAILSGFDLTIRKVLTSHK